MSGVLGGKMPRDHPEILHEIVERIDVYQTQSKGKNRTQQRH